VAVRTTYALSGAVLVTGSPWARRGYVSHVHHTAITRLIELLFDLPALTPRDANSDLLLAKTPWGVFSG